MAEVYDSVPYLLDTDTLTTIFTVGASKARLIKSILCANVDPTEDTAVSVAYRKSGDSVDHYVCRTVLVPVQAVFDPVNGSILNLVDGDILKIKAEDADRLDITVNFLELDQ